MNQKIIGLDETGIFEGNDTNLRLIGGFVGLCADPEQEEAEWEAFFIQLLENINAEYGWGEGQYRLLYPYSLHMNGKNIFTKKREDGTLDLMLYDARKPVRDTYASKRKAISARIIKETLERMKERGYRLYAMVDSGAVGGMGSNVVDFDVAGNRYERLAILALYHTIFYQIKPDVVDTLHLHLATRALFFGPDENESASLAEQLYRSCGTDRLGARYLANTTQSTFKTALADKYYERGHLLEKMDFSFHVEPANYRVGDEKKQPFLYLADVVCSYLRGLLMQHTPIEATSQSKLPLDLWVYGDVDRLWRRALDRYQEGRLGECFSLLYEMTKGTSPVHDYYRKVWAEGLEKKLLEELELSEEKGRRRRREVFLGMPVFLAEIEQDMMNHQMERGLYLADRMREIWERLVRMEPRYMAQGKRYLFQIHDLMLRGFNYRGAVDGMREHMNECDRYRQAVLVEEYIYHIIRVLQYYFNSYRFEKAEEVAVQLEETVGKLMEAYRACTQAGRIISGEILGSGAKERSEEPLRCLAAGRLYSTLGQIYGFLGKYGPAKRMFSQAEEVFGPGENYRITLCHELQLYIDQKKKREYERAAIEYFGTDELWGQWNEMVSGLPYTAYGLQAFIKAFRVFYAMDPSNHYLVKEMVKCLGSGNGFDGHPWQIIYQNLYRIVEMTGVEAEKADWFAERMLTCTKSEPCMDVMRAYYRILTAEQKGEGLSEAIAEMKDILTRHHMEESFPELTTLSSNRKVCSYLKKKIRYEYV